MNLWSTFLDLDKLHESTDKEKRWSDQALDELKNKPKSEWTDDDWETYHYCKNANAERDYYDSLDEDFYDFEQANTSSWVKMQPANNQIQASQQAKQASVYVVSTRKAADLQQPDFCEFEQGDVWHGVVEYADKLISGTGHFDSLYDAVAVAKKNNQHFDLYIYEYDASANKLTLVGKVDKAVSQPATPSTNQSARTSTAPSKPIVTIVKDSGKLRALAANGDGQGNPAAFVQFPTVLRTNEGQQYEVDQLVWTGKFYRVSGNISPIITNVATSTTSTQNITENINKENSKMNFNSVFEELNKLYEEKLAKGSVSEETKKVIKPAKTEDYSHLDQINCEVCGIELSADDYVLGEDDYGSPVIMCKGCHDKEESSIDVSIPSVAYILLSSDEFGIVYLNVVNGDFVAVNSLSELNSYTYSLTKEAAIAMAKAAYNVTERSWQGKIDVIEVTNFKVAYACGKSPVYRVVYSVNNGSFAEACLKEAADDEIEFAEEPVDVIPEEETEEAPAEEDVNTVEEFLKSIGEYDGDLKLEFKPIVIDGKEYNVNNILWSDEEEGKLVAEFVVDMPEEEAVEEEPAEESVNKDENLEELLDFNVPVNVPVHVTANGNDVAVGGLA